VSREKRYRNASNQLECFRSGEDLVVHISKLVSHPLCARDVLPEFHKSHFARKDAVTAITLDLQVRWDYWYAITI
jgi:hypothetical protein